MGGQFSGLWCRGIHEKVSLLRMASRLFFYFAGYDVMGSALPSGTQAGLRQVFSKIFDICQEMIR